MTAIIALIPAGIAVLLGLKSSAKDIFLNVYLPTLLLFPEYYFFAAPGLPDPNANQAVILVVAFLYALRDLHKGWRLTLTDLIVLTYAVSVGYSEYRAAGYKEAQNLMIGALTSVLLPYLMTKGLIEPNRLREKMAKRITLLLGAVACFNLYEFRFGLNPYRLMFDRFFPGQGRSWVVTIRWGFGRAAGPFGHPILSGVIMIVGFRLARWLQWSRLWPKKAFSWIPWQPLSTAAIVTWTNVLGSVITLCRGPWLGGMLAAFIVWIGKTRNKWVTVVVLFVALIAGGIPASINFYNYVAVGREGALSETQETAAYRFELIGSYLEFVAEKPLFGWGRNTWPKVPAQPSIDNHYLLLLLMHGWSATGTLLLALVVVGSGLLRSGMREPPSDPRGSSFAFTLLGIIVSIYFSIATVFMGLQTAPMLFIMLGWADGYLCYGQPHMIGPQPPPPFRFRRVLA